MILRRNNQLNLFYVCCLVAMVLAGCGKSSSDKSTQNSATVINVLTINHKYRAIASMPVTLANNEFTEQLTTDENGNVSFSVDYAKVKFPLVLSTRLNGYTNQVKIIKDLVKDTINSVELSVLQRDLPTTFDSEQQTTISTSDGAYLDLPANALVDQQGNPVTGSVQAYVTPLNTSNDNALQLFPGEFAGTLAGDDTVRQIATYGTTEFYFEQNGQPLNLAPDVQATIELPIYTFNHPDGSGIRIDDLIDLWHLEEQTGLWKNEGQGTVVHSRRSPTTLALRAQVAHFSWWNADASLATRAIRITFIGDFDGNCRVELSSETDGTGPGSKRSIIVDITNGADQEFIIPAETNLDLTVSLNANGAAYQGTAKIGKNDSSGDITIELMPGGANNNDAPIPNIVTTSATVSPGFDYDIDSDTYILTHNIIRYYWKVITGKPKQSGCNNDASVKGEEIEITLFTNARLYSEVALGDDAGQLDLSVFPFASGSLPADPASISLSLTATNAFGADFDTRTEANENYAAPAIEQLTATTIDNFQHLNLKWRVEGADTAKIEVRNITEPNGTPIGVYPFDPSDGEYDWELRGLQEQGILITVVFVNQYGQQGQTHVINDAECFGSELGFCL